MRPAAPRPPATPAARAAGRCGCCRCRSRWRRRPGCRGAAARCASSASRSASRAAGGTGRTSRAITTPRCDAHGVRLWVFRERGAPHGWFLHGCSGEATLRRARRYAELHCLSNFTFLRGASHPHELVERADALGYRRSRSPMSARWQAWCARTWRPRQRRAEAHHRRGVPPRVRAEVRRAGHRPARLRRGCAG